MGYIYQMPIDRFKLDYNLDIAVETGTQWGYGTRFLADQFSDVYTVEIDLKMWRRAYDFFRQRYNVYCLYGPSPRVLDSLLSDELRSMNILFWLDAHYPNDDYDVKGKDLDTVFPLRGELEVIYRLRNEGWANGIKDVIIIDDARLYSRMEEWEKGPGEYCFNDISFLDLFKRTHRLEVDKRETGYFILIPL